MEDWQEQLQLMLKGLPDSPGVYLYKDETGKVIYVGKAKILKNRVRSYFQVRDDKGVKTEALVASIRALEIIVTKTEAEALLLENTLIKKYKPHYNILLKDDKGYPYVRISVQEDFPRIEFTRKMLKDGARYFGTYVRPTAVRETIELIRKLFPIRTCKREIHVGDQQRPCLFHHIGLCSAPCSSAVSKEEYTALVKSACAFLEGRVDDVLKALQLEMEADAEAMRFEHAAVLRDRIRAVQEISSHQSVSLTRGEERDIVALHVDDWHAAVSVLFIRDGRLTGKHAFLLEGAGATPNGEILDTFLVQYYSGEVELPKELLLSEAPASPEALVEFLSQKRGSRVNLHVPQRGIKSDQMDLAMRNAREEMDQFGRVTLAKRTANYDALKRMSEQMGLDEIPSRIEAYDVSNTGSSEIVASMVVFVDGNAEPSLYRRFKMKYVQSPDDYASMQEAVLRRFKRYLDDSADEAFSRKPHLILADGGIGHVSSVMEVLEEVGLDIPVWGMAKDDKHRSHRLVNGSRVIYLNDYPEILRLVASVQNEAHRFAIQYNKKLRSKRTIQSALDTIPGVGSTRRKALLKAFGSVAKMKKAAVEEIAQVENIGPKLAAVILEHLNPPDNG